MTLVEKLAEVLREFRAQDGALLSKEKELHDAVLSAIEEYLKK